MDDYALVINAGSSSLKFFVLVKPKKEWWQIASKGQIDGIGTAPHLKSKDAEGKVQVDRDLDSSVNDGKKAVTELADWLRSMYGGSHVLAVGHRVVHGGPKFTTAQIITPEVLDELRRLVPLAPLHQPFNITAIEAAMERLPDVLQVACFDTSFHRGQPTVAEVVPLPRELCRQGLQRYGFHGLSYEYIASVLPEVAPEIAHGRVIVAHLGSGASLCALSGGKSVESTLGYTALDGLCMGTRPGAIDPGIILYLVQNLQLSAKEIETILYKKSGLLGISGISNDMRDLLNSKDPAAELAIDYFVYEATKQIGAMAAVLGGIDGLVFTAGIGENSPEIRARLCRSSAWLGIEFDEAANASRGPRISTPGSKVSAWVIPTNEELMIARHTGRLLGLI
jgi:acetate kinase